VIEADAVLGRFEHHCRVRADAARDEVERAVARVLLVHDALHDDLAPQRHARLAQVGHGHDRGHEPALHVGGAAPVHEAVLDVGAEGRMAPLAGGLDGDAVDVPVEDERAPAARALEASDDVRPPAVVQHVLQAARAQRLARRQLLVRQDQVVLPVGGVLRDVREFLEDERDIGFARFDLGAHRAQQLGHARLRGTFLAGQARDAHDLGQRADAMAAVALGERECRFGPGDHGGVVHVVPFAFMTCA
jgi:hypothetical protein